jgi:alkane 1-monooxygenase
MTRRTKDPTAWFDHKRHGWLLGPSVPLLACVSLAAYLVAPHTAWCWVPPALIFLVLPALEALIGTDNRNGIDGVLTRDIEGRITDLRMRQNRGDHQDEKCEEAVF